MIHLIGGVPRVGKSTLARLLLKRDKIGYVDADWLIHMLMYAAPQLGVKIFSAFNDKEYNAKANNFYPFLYQFIKYNQPVVDQYLIEGDSFLPEHVLLLRKDFEVKACFLGSSHITPEILLANPGVNDWWIKKLSPKKLNELCSWIMLTSKFLKKDCNDNEIAYFDMSKNHSEQIEAAYKYLTDK